MVLGPGSISDRVLVLGLVQVLGLEQVPVAGAREYCAGARESQGADILALGVLLSSDWMATEATRRITGTRMTSISATIITFLKNTFFQYIGITSGARFSNQMARYCLLFD